MHLVSETNVASGKPNELVPRRVGEAIGSTVGTLATIVNYPIGIIHLIWHTSYYRVAAQLIYLDSQVQQSPVTYVSVSVTDQTDLHNWCSVPLGSWQCGLSLSLINPRFVTCTL